LETSLPTTSPCAGYLGRVDTSLAIPSRMICFSAGVSTSWFEI
jgi:hypothetical protein